MRLAYISPLPPTRSGIADYSADLAPELLRQASVTFFTAQPEATTMAWQQPAEVAALNDYPRRRWEFDLTLYQVGNSRYHAAMYPLWRRYPGVAVLHDYVLHHLMAMLSYGRELGYELGAAGAWGVRFGRMPPLETLPLNRRLLNTSLGVIVHSRYVADLIRASHPQLPTTVIPMPIPSTTPPTDTAAVRAALGLPPEALVLGSFGQITPNRQPELGLRAFVRLQRRYPHLYYLIAGEAVGVDLSALLQTLPAAAQAQVLTRDYVTDRAQFDAYLAATDVVLNLRHPTMGETSGVALRALALGRPLVVFDVGWYHELPADVALRCPVLDEEALLTTLTRVLDSAATRVALSQAAGRYIADQHAPSAVAGRYITFLHALLAQRT